MRDAEEEGGQDPVLAGNISNTGGHWQLYSKPVTLWALAGGLTRHSPDKRVQKHTQERGPGAPRLVQSPRTTTQRGNTLRSVLPYPKAAGRTLQRRLLR